MVVRATLRLWKARAAPARDERYILSLSRSRHDDQTSDPNFDPHGRRGARGRARARYLARAGIGIGVGVGGRWGARGEGALRRGQRRRREEARRRAAEAEG